MYSGVILPLVILMAVLLGMLFLILVKYDKTVKEMNHTIKELKALLKEYEDNDLTFKQ